MQSVSPGAVDTPMRWENPNVKRVLLNKGLRKQIKLKGLLTKQFKEEFIPVLVAMIEAEFGLF